MVGKRFLGNSRFNSVPSAGDTAGLNAGYPSSGPAGWVPTDEDSMQTYQGSCHFGLVRFEITADLDYVGVCDCSMCLRRRALMHAVDDNRFKVFTALKHLSLYTFNTHIARDYFCSRCGVLPFPRPRRASHLWGINVRCLDDVDLNSIPVRSIAGSDL